MPSTTLPLPIGPVPTVQLIAAGRLAIGVVAYARPQVGGPAFTTGEMAPEAVDGWRLAGARDIALGLGLFMAGRRGAHRIRGWAEAAALADLMDTVAFATSPGLKPLARAAGALTALAAGLVGASAASQIERG